METKSWMDLNEKGHFDSYKYGRLAIQKNQIRFSSTIIRINLKQQ